MNKAIWAMGLDYSMGKTGTDTGLPWEKIPEDFDHYKSETKIIKYVKVGKNTYESIFAYTKGKLLKGRILIVISKTMTQPDRADVIVCRSLYDATNIFPGEDKINSGGKQLYETDLGATDEVIITLVHEKFPDADYFFDASFITKFERDFVEDVNRKKILRPASEDKPLVTAHYYVRRTGK